MVEVPIYRAKRVGFDKWVEGFFFQDQGKTSYITNGTEYADASYNVFFDKTEIDPSTLALHFPNMIDKNGKKMYASLSEDGLGADEVTITFTFRKQESQIKTYIYIKDNMVRFKNSEANYLVSKDLEVTGIKGIS